MQDVTALKAEIESLGFAIVENVLSSTEIEAILHTINKASIDKPTCRKTTELFAIRQFLKEIPEVLPFVIVQRIKDIMEQVFGQGFFIVKSIYFDKPGGSNWFVSYHQDLTISVTKKWLMEGFGPWTVKQDQFSVQPPLAVLQDNFTVRLHLDDTDENNGALKVIPGSHLKGIYRPETIDWSTEKEVVCRAAKGSVMIMRPLLLHASNRTTNSKQRRVIHIEFSRFCLPGPLEWSEKMVVA
jgi:ectoine hydroxylase-related dioxygenase (phytanoyl-CoA dioxygenase family)